MDIPNDIRIPFKKGWHIARWDQKAFKLWALGVITTEEAMEQISANNNTHVTYDQFITNAEMLGYFRIGRNHEI